MQSTKESMAEQSLLRDIYPVLPDRIRSSLTRVPYEQIKGIEEIRLRAERPLMVSEGGRDYFISASGKQKDFTSGCMMIERLDI